VSGRRLWALLRQHYASTEAFIAEAFVANYCPLLFLDAAGRNLTPDKIGRQDRRALYAACDRFLVRLVETLQPRWTIGVGVFAAARLQDAVGSLTSGRGGAPGFAAPRVVRIPHPSPANPLANRDWGPLARAVLVREGIWTD
jgi:single-strand selective monofunctional uracil DNA glycosylase